MSVRCGTVCAHRHTTGDQAGARLGISQSRQRRTETEMKRAVIAWLLTGLVLALSAELAWEYLWIAALAPMYIWALLGLVLMGMAGWRLRDPDQRRTGWAA